MTKGIKGRAYRYAVESFRDPQTGQRRTRWRYLGRVVGELVIAPAPKRVPTVTRDELVAAIASLLESRDPARVTVDVIAKQTGVSAARFYRYFPSRRAALGVAADLLCERLVAGLPALGDRLGAEADERERLRTWFTNLQRTLLRGRAPLLLQPADRPAIVQCLASYLQSLDGAGLAAVDDAPAIAVALLRVHNAVVRAGAPSAWSEVWPLLERAIFRKVAARATESPRSDRLSHHDRNRSPRA